MHFGAISQSAMPETWQECVYTTLHKSEDEEILWCISNSLRSAFKFNYCRSRGGRSSGKLTACNNASSVHSISNRTIKSATHPPLRPLDRKEARFPFFVQTQTIFYACLFHPGQKSPIAPYGNIFLSQCSFHPLSLAL